MRTVEEEDEVVLVRRDVVEVEKRRQKPRTAEEDRSRIQNRLVRWCTTLGQQQRRHGWRSAGLFAWGFGVSGCSTRPTSLATAGTR